MNAPPPPGSPPPPGAPPPAGPPQDRPRGSSLEAFPWEGWQEDFPGSLTSTIRLLVTDPANAFARLRRDGDFLTPLAFGVGISMVGYLVSLLWNLLLQGAQLSWLGQDTEALTTMIGGGIFGAGCIVLFVPVFALLWIFILSGLMHLLLGLFGGLQRSETGYEGSLKVVCYASVTQLAGIVPFIGPLVAIVLGLILQTLGLREVHRTTTGRALAAVLGLWVLCCGTILFIGIAAAIAIPALVAAGG